MERASLYEPFIGLAVRLHPPVKTTTFPQLRQLTQKTSKADNNWNSSGDDDDDEEEKVEKQITDIERISSQTNAL